MSQSFTNYLRVLSIVLLTMVCTMRSEAISLSTNDLTHSMGSSYASNGILSNAGLRNATLGAWRALMPDSKAAPTGIIIGGTVTSDLCYGATTGDIILSVSGGTSPYTYSWSNGYTQSNPHSLAAGPYTVIVHDATGASASKSFTVTQPTEIIAFINCTPVCFGECNGTASITASGGTPGYTYTWSGPNGFSAGNVTSITSLCGGTYWVTVKDANGCLKIVGGTVCSSPKIVVTGTTTNATCYGTCNGSVTVSASEGSSNSACTTTGTTPFTYAWSGPHGYTASNLTTLNGLCAGTYYVTVTNQKNCNALDTFIITQPDSLHVTNSHNNATCYNECNGTATVSVSGGTPSYTISWNNANVSGLTPTGLCAGTYCYTVNDANSCSKSGCITITQPDSIHITLTRNSTCLSIFDSTASLTAVATGGTGSFTYSWSGPNGFTASGSTILINQSGVKYHVTVTDGNSCSKVDSIAVPSCACPAGSLTIEGPDSVCYKSLPVTLTAHSSLAAETYSWVGPNGFTSSGATDSVITVSAGGIYTATVVFGPTPDCKTSASDTIVIKSQPAVTVNSTNIPCNSECNGTITLTVTNVTSYTTSWTGPVGFTSINSPSLSGLCAGQYCYTVNADGCTSNGCVTITQPDTALTIIPTFNNATCYGSCNGNASISVSGGTRPYTITWDHNALSGFQVSDLCIGTYCFTVTDANNCSSSGCVSIDQPDSLHVTYIPTNVTCYGSCNGSATVTVTGGTVGNSDHRYRISWAQDGVSGFAPTGLCAGTYCFTVSDANSCSKSGCVTITQPDSLSVTTGSHDLTCYNSCDGAASVSVTGGTPDANGNYTIVWNTDGVTGFSPSPLCAGTYCFTVSDVNGCSKSGCIIVNQPDSLSAPGFESGTSCYNSCDGGVLVIITGGTQDPNAPGGYTIVWNNPDFNGQTLIFDLCAGTYCYTVTDANGCSKTSCVTVTSPDSLTITTNTTNVSCYNSCNGSATITVTGGTTAGADGNPYNILWDNANVSGFTPTGLCAGTYCYTVSDQDGCSKSGCITITQPDSLSIIPSHTNATCYGVCNGTISLSVSGGSAIYTYSWSHDASVNGNELEGLCAGTYCYTVTDANTCSKSGCITITQPDSLTLTNNSTNVTCYGSCNGTASVTVSGGTPSYTISWSDNSDISSFSRQGLCAGEYCYIVYDANNCSKSGCITITQPDSLTITTTPVNVTCYNACNGSATVSVSGGTPSYTISWNNANVSGFDPTALCAGTYCYTVSDANSCSKTGCITITQPDSLTITTTTNNVTCYNACNGSATVTVSGGTANSDRRYKISWNNDGVNGFAPTGLCAGTYCFTVSDANNCSKSGCITITQPDSLTITTTPVNVTCYNACNGSATVTVSGGTPSYTISWNNANVSGFAPTALCAGSYCYTVSDANSCVKSGCITITQPDSLTITTTSDNVTCYNACNGSATVTVSGGTQVAGIPVGYIISWNSKSAVGFAPTGLCAGTYCYTVSDANSCSKSGCITITQPDSLTVTVTPTNSSCNNACNGSITVEVSGGTVGNSDRRYRISWNNEAVTGFAPTGLCAGTYCYTVSDANSCSKSGCVTITQPDTIKIVPSHTNVTCYGECNGIVSVSVSGGTSPYTYSWSHDGAVNGFEQEQLCIGTYCITVTDANKCSKSVCVTITQPDSLTLTNNSTNLTCSGTCNGTLSVGVTGGTPNYTILWLDNSDITSFSREGLCAGEYCYIVFDANNCSKSGCIIITEPDTLSITTTSTNVSCYNACNGSATVSVSGGTASYTISWNNANVSGFTPSALCAGTYCFTITDANTCSKTGCVTISQPDSLHVTNSSSNVTCYNACNGTATVTVSGGTPSYTISWNNANVSGLAPTGLCAGTYCYTVTDANSCSKTGCVTISQPDSLTITVQTDNTSCYNSCDGNALVTISGGTPSYTISWADANLTGTLVQNLCAGTYCFTVTDANGCAKSSCLTITQPDSLHVVVSHTDVTCYNACNGTIIVTVTGGTTAGADGSPYNILWNNVNVSGFAPTGLCAGTYCYTVSDQNGCSKTGCVTVIQPDSLTVDTSHTDLTCNEINGPCDGTITVSASGGTAPYTITWSDNLFGATGGIQTNLCPDTYCYTVTDANGCSKSGCITINQPPMLLIASNCCPDNITCHNACNGKIDISIFGGVPPFTYAWSGPNGYTSTDSNITQLCPGIYTVTVTDKNGCSYDNTHAPLTNPDSIVSNISGTVNTNCNGNCNGTATVAPTGGTGTYTITWSTTATGVNTITGLCAGKYYVTIVDQLGCSIVDSIRIFAPSCACPTITASSTNVPCYGGTGSITLHISQPIPAGTTILLYGPNGSVTTETDTLITGLAAGQYCYVVTTTSISGCKDSSCITITQPDSLHVTASSTNPAPCSLACTGTATVTVSGGTPSYTISWNNANVSGFTPTALCADTYCYTVTDANGCSKTGCVTLTQPSGTLSAPNVSSNVTCYGSCNGTATVTVSGGTPSYTISWNNANVSGLTPTGLCAGTYCYTVNDANGCSVSNCITISQPDSLHVTATSTNPAPCSLTCTGTATVTVSGGTPSYTISWNHDGVRGFTPTALCADTYCYTVTDANGCSKTGCVTLTQPSSTLTATYVSSNVTCYSSCNGTATVTPSGGTPNYTITWNKEGVRGLTPTGLCAGTYCYTVHDANGCSASNCITITQPDSLHVTATSTNGTCNASCNGTATVTVSGGTPTYTISWNNANVSGFTPTGLCADTYCYTVSDAHGCSKSGCVTITQATLTVTVEHSNLTCASTCAGGSCDGTISLTITGAGSPTVKWSGPNKFSSSSSSLTKLCAGTYCYTVTSGTCSETGCVTLTQPATLSLSVTGTNISCNGNCNGTASVTVSSGDAPFTYSWSTKAKTSGISGLCAGTYCVTVTSVEGCTASGCVCITTPAPLCLTVCSSNTTCNGSCNGTASVSVSGGSAPYTYSWGTGAKTSSVSGLCVGTYCVTVTSTGGCSASKCVCITAPASLSLSICNTNVTCNGSCNGTASVSATGGTSPYTYHWSNGSSCSSISGLCATTYCVTVTSKGGCTASKCVTISQPASITLTTTSTNITCNGSANGSASVTVTGGTGPFSYHWSNGACTSSICGLCAGTYCVTVTSCGGCSASACVCITQPTPICVTLTTSNETCGSSSDGSASVTVTGGTGTYTYHWSTGGTKSSITGLCPGSYSVTVSTTGGCCITKSFTICPSSSSVKICTSGTNATSGDNGSACVTSVSGGTAPYTYEWACGKTTCCIYDLGAGTYCVTVSDANHCSATGCVTVSSSCFGLRVEDSNEGGSQDANAAPIVNTYPNPFTTYSNIDFTVPNDDNNVVLEIYSITGVKIAELYNGQVKGGIKNSVRFTNSNLSDDMYIYRLVTSNKTLTGNLMLIK